MACSNWIPLWMSHLYGETSREEADRVEDHLNTCAPCRTEYEAASSTRRLMSEHAPRTPAAPAVMLLSARPTIRPWMAFAAGVLITALVSVVSFRFGAEAEHAQVVSEPAPGPELVQDWARQAVDRRMDDWTREQVQPLTREDLDAALSVLADRVEQTRRSDLDYLMARIDATEQRTEGWMDDTQRALQYVAYASNPGISPR